MSDDDRTTRPGQPGTPSPGPSDRTVLIATPRRRRGQGDFDANPTPFGVPPTPSSFGPTQGDDWSAPLAQGARPASASVGAAAPILVGRHSMGAPNANVILRAAMPLLLTLGGLRVALISAPVADLMKEVADAISDFEAEIQAAKVPSDQVRTAKYILCATADDIMQNLPGDRHAWTQYSMLSQFFGERNGGIVFFEILSRLKLDPLPNCDVLELQHACLTLGFEGMHRTTGGSTAELQQTQRNLYETIRRVRRPEIELSPHWQGKPIAAYGARFRIPVWTVAAFLGALLFVLYILLRTILGNAAEGAALAEAAIHPTAALAIQRRVINTPPPPPPPATKPQELQLARIKRELAAEIESKRVSVQQTADEIIVRLGTFALFASGDAQVTKAFAPIAERIKAMLENETGYVKITGFSDNSPLRSIKFASNYDLSLARAKAVAGNLKQGLKHPERIKILGRGEQQPIGDNDTKDGRALNRRVEISIPRVD